MSKDVFNIGCNEINKLLEIWECKSKKFTDLAEVSGLNPSEDFAFADLRRVDFSRCNLESYDFTGADLRAADFRDARGLRIENFVGVKFDRYTVWPVFFQDLIEAGGVDVEREARSIILQRKSPPRTWARFIRKLNLSDTDFCDFKLLGGLKYLEFLLLIRSNVTDLSGIEQMPGLQSVNFMGCKINNIDEIRNLKKLQFVGIKNTNVCDIKCLEDLPILSHVILSGTRVVDLAPLLKIGTLREVTCIGLPADSINFLKENSQISIIESERDRKG